MSTVTHPPSDWKETRLGDQLREPIRNGYSPVCPVEPTGKWILHLGAVTADGFNRQAVKPAPPNDPKVNAAILQIGDIVVSRSNTRARVGFAGLYDGSPSLCAYSDLLMRVRPGRDLDERFLLYALLSPEGRAYFERSARGTSGSMVKIDRAILENFPLKLPPLTEQRKIAAILSSVDDTIQKAEAVIDQLEVVKKGLLEELLTCGMPGRHKEFRETEIGRVPASWKILTLGDLTSSSAFGPRFPASFYDLHGGFATLRTTDISDDGAIDYDAMPRAALPTDQLAEHVLQPGDLLITRSGTCGIASVFEQHALPVVPGAFLIRFRLNDQVIPAFLRLYVMSSRPQKRVQGMAAGGVQKNLSGTNLKTLPVVLPGRDEQAEIVEAEATLRRSLVANRAHLGQLQRAKAALLDALLSGRVRVAASGQDAA